ncbi:MAG: hypothetical protein C4523_10090 [Myxococcales bacterium]|nr:MAG: hypothetical protein C4523_10090 [Myxococcales bacterium]
MKKARFIGVFVSAMLVSSLAGADYAPQEMTFSGQLFSPGCGYTAAPQNATFTLWTAASGGSQVGGALTLSNVGMSDGVISVILTNPIVASILNWSTSSGALYLQVQLANGWTSERRKLTSAPYALTCTEADSIGGLTLTDLDSRYVLNSGGSLDTRYVRNQYDGAQSANHWISGYSRADTAMYTPILYDINNTGYYSDPNGVSRLNDIRPDIIYDPNNTGYYIDINSTSRANYFVFDNAYAYGWMQAPIFYDANNNDYRVDPDYISYFNDIRPNIIYDRQNTGYYLDPNGTTYVNDFRANIIYDPNNTGYYIDINNVSRINYGIWDNMYAYGWLQSDILYDLYNNGYYFQGRGSSLHNHMWSRFQYDYDNTGYYFDINGWSVTYGQHIVDLRNQYGYDWNNTGYYWDYNSWSLNWVDRAYYQYAIYGFYYGKSNQNEAPKDLTTKDLFAKLDVIRNVRLSEALITQHATAPDSDPDPQAPSPRWDDPNIDQALIDANDQGSQAGMLQGPAEKYGIKDRVRNQLMLDASSLPSDMVEPVQGGMGGTSVSMTDLDVLTIAGLKAVDIDVQKVKQENDLLRAQVKDLTARLEKMEELLYGKPAKPR